MKPVSVSITISRPRAEVFEYLADVANHEQFFDHVLVDWHLTREDSYGMGAGARYRIKRPGPPAFADSTIIELDPPERIVFAGRTGRFNRIPTFATWTLAAGSDQSTTVEVTLQSEPATPADRLVERLSGQRAMIARGTGKALERLRGILEGGGGHGERATVSGGARKPASGFRL
jgi:uncharacterized protein YndB with AHSA1/START domain